MDVTADAIFDKGMRATYFRVALAPGGRFWREANVGGFESVNQNSRSPDDCL
jgi:hypothetical protein